MKSRQQIVDMMRAIKNGMQNDTVNVRHGTAQCIILAWVLDILPPAAEKFQNCILEYKFDFNTAMLIEEAKECAEQTNDAIEEAIK